MSPRPQLNHLGLYTSQLARMEDFYVNVMGLLVTDRGCVPRLGDVSIVFMSANSNDHHQLALIERTDSQGPSCVNQIAFKVQGLSELRKLHDRLQRLQTDEVSAIDHGNAWSVYAADPDGNGVEIYVDTPWHVSQPNSRRFDISLPDEVIHDSTEEFVRGNPTFLERGEWSELVASKL